MFNKFKQMFKTQDEKNLDLVMSIDGQISRQEAEELFDLSKAIPKDFVIVEIGSFRGRSTIALAKGVLSGNSNRIYAIDPHQEFTGAFGGVFGPKDQEELYMNLSKAKVGRVVSVVSLPSTLAAKAWIEKNIGLLWIDGDHRYDAVRADYLSWSPYIAKDGLIVFHDSRMGDVKKMISEIVQNGEIVFTKQIQDIGVYKYLKG